MSQCASEVTATCSLLVKVFFQDSDWPTASSSSSLSGFRVRCLLVDVLLTALQVCVNRIVFENKDGYRSFSTVLLYMWTRPRSSYPVSHQCAGKFILD